MFVYSEVTSKLAICLFLMSMFCSFLMRSPEFLMCEGLMVPSRGVRILAIALAILWWVLPIPEIMGLIGILTLWVLGSPYR